MKTSETLRQEASEEENDLKAFGLIVKALRESRSEKFTEDWLPLLEKRYSVIEDNFKYTITTQEYGVLDFFPKANKLLRRNINKWYKPGLKWIINHLFKK